MLTTVPIKQYRKNHPKREQQVKYVHHSTKQQKTTPKENNK